MPRLLTTSASAIRKLLHKANLMGIDSEALEVQEAQMSALSDVRKKWHIQPAFSVEFIGYFLDRITRLRDIKNNLEVQVSSNAKLVTDQQFLKEKYDQMIRDNEELAKESETLREKIQLLHSSISSLCPNKTLPLAGSIGKPATSILVSSTASSVLPCLTVPPPASTPPARPMSVPTAAALKMGVGFPLQNPSTTNNAGKILSTQRPDKNELLHECGICKRCTDQHLLAKCDTCHFHYHLGCLNPPLTRHPKKGKLYGWQCSECDKSDCSDTGMTMPEGPRKSRTRYSKDGTIVSANSAPPSPPPTAPAPAPTLPVPVVAVAKVEVKEENSLNKSVNGGKSEGDEENPPKSMETPSESIKIEPMIIPKMKITPTRGRGRGRGRGRPPGRKSLEVRMSSNGSSSRSEAQSPTSLPVSIPVVWPTNLSPVVAPTATAVAVPLIIPPEPPTTPKASKSEKRKAKKEKKLHQKLQVAAEHSPPPVYYIAPEKISSQEAAEDAEDEEDTDNEVPETNESIVGKNLMNLSHELSQSNADTSSAALNTADLDGEDKANHHRKKKNKEKHKNKNHDSDASKEHKRKRKRKYGMENTTEEFADVHGASHPRIKIKFKAIPLPGTSAADVDDGGKQFVYMPTTEQSPKRVKSPYKMKSPDHGMRSPIKQIVSYSFIYLTILVKSTLT